MAVADLDGDGRPELVVLMVDNPPGQNRGLYRVGRALDAEGNVANGWGEWKEVPDWFSWENQGAGVAVADLSESGLADLVVLHVDSPVGQNQAFFRIGKKLDVDGAVAGGWTSWLGVPDWFSWENQGAGVATVSFDARHHIVSLLVDNALGQNSGQYRVLVLEGDPATEGSWEVLPYLSEVLPVHGATLPSGKVLFFAGSGNSAVRFSSPDFGDTSKGVSTSVVWDPAVPPTNGEGSFSHPETLRDVHGRVIDLFCCGHAFLPDGALLAAGGTLDYPGPGHGFMGRPDAVAFDFRTENGPPRPPWAMGAGTRRW